jgi:hypothetical protein
MGAAQHRVGGVSDRTPAGTPAPPKARKLGLEPGLSVSLDAAPDGWRLTDPPPGLD